MNRLQLYIIFFVALCYSSKAQYYNPFQPYYPHSKYLAGAYAEYIIGSNAITADLINNLYQGKYISTEKKDQTLANIKNQNNIGGDANAGFFYSYRPDTASKKSLGYWIAGKSRNHADMRFSKDFFKMAFYGNKQFEGKTADMSNFNLNLIQFQQIQVGVSKRINQGEATYGLGLSLLNGQNYRSLLASKAELYTAPDGDYIDFKSDIVYKLSDTTHQKFGATNGVGMGIDLYADIPYVSKKNREERIIIEIKDIGMIWWGDKSYVMDRDTTFRYEGVRVNNIFNIQNQTFGNTNKDSILHNLQPLKHQKFTSTLPTQLNFYTISTFKKLQLTKGIRYIFNANAKINAFINASYFFSKNFTTSLGVSYGGYSKLNIHFGMGINVGKGIMIHAYSHNIEGYLLPKNAVAQGMYLSLLKFF